MSFKHLLCALLVAITWGSNFVALKTAFTEIPPFLFLTLRFLLCSVPLLLFVPRPKISFKLLLSISLFQWIAHFSLLFLALYLGIPGGIASLILQSQIIFTMLFSAMWLQSRLHPLQIIGIAVSLVGISMIGLQMEGQSNLISFILLIGSAISISVANIMFKKASNVNMLSLVVWSSLIPPIPMFLMSLYFEGWPNIVCCLQNLSFSVIAAVLYTSWMATLVGLSLWAYLMSKNDPSHVVPFSLLIPVIALATTSWFLGETLSTTILFAGIIIFSGLIINQWPMIQSLLVKNFYAKLHFDKLITFKVKKSS